MNYSLLTKILAPAGILLFVPLVYRLLAAYGKRSGKPFSTAYKVWLAYLLYVYLFLSPVLAFDEGIPAANLTSIRYFAVLIYVRVVLQYAFTFWKKRWTPLIGFSYNLFCLFQFSYLYNTYAEAFLAGGAPYHSSGLFLQIVVGCLLADSLYTLLAYRNRQPDNRLMQVLNVLFSLALLVFLGSVYL
ncbi:hypothetical protein [Pontibacter beigongshangensis]|uniref:hypothetical protein n=1 Tax=Pontibacter beigongshangensis TaxID=2574733 RepID=UPI001650D1EA|nr:hypothetical protein [Pontibacter beigongshangensis]